MTKPLTTRPPIFPTRNAQGAAWIRQVSDALHLQARDWPLLHPMRKSLNRKAIAIKLCISKTTGHICNDCGSPQGRSGILENEGQPCHSRSCPACARRRSAELADRLSTAIDNAPVQTDKNTSWGWKMLTITAPYEPWNESDLTIKSLYRRANNLKKRWRKMWSQVGSQYCGAWVSLEIAGTGHVHMHVIYYGPWISPVSIAIWNLDGHVDVREITDAKKGAIEVVKYSVKSPGANNDKWIAGFSDGLAECLHPVLAARWEVATHGMRIGERYGFLRRAPKPEEQTVEEIQEKDRKKQNCECGACSWKRKSFSTPVWVQLCVDHNFKAFGNPVLSLDQLDKIKIENERNDNKGKREKWLKELKKKLKVRKSGTIMMYQKQLPKLT